MHYRHKLNSNASSTAVSLAAHSGLPPLPHCLTVVCLAENVPCAHLLQRLQVLGGPVLVLVLHIQTTCLIASLWYVQHEPTNIATRLQR
jgi:hypothetical protein